MALSFISKVVVVIYDYLHIVPNIPVAFILDECHGGWEAGGCEYEPMLLGTAETCITTAGKTANKENCASMAAERRLKHRQLQSFGRSYSLVSVTPEKY